MNARNSLITAPINRTLLLFALPTLGSSILQSANGSINAVWVGRLLGEGALAATTNGNLVMFLLTAFVFGFGMASTILIGQSIGKGDIHAAREVVGTAIGAFIPAAVVISVLGWIIAPDLLALLGTPPEIQHMARDFLRITFVAMPAILMQTMLMMALRGSGDSLTPLIFMALAAALDVVLNPLLIRGIGPIPPFGISGAALATAVANYISLSAMIWFIYARDLPMRLRGTELRMLIPSRHILGLMVTKGLPMGIQMIVISSSMLAMMNLVNQEGVATSAAFGATQQLWTYVQMPAMALGAAVSAMAAQNIGAGRWDRVSQITRAGIIFNLILTGALVVVFYFADAAAMAIFLGPDSEAIPIGQHIGQLSTWGFIAFGVTMVLFGTIRANGQVIWPLIILFISMYPVRIGFALGLRGLLGVDALWLSFPIAMVATLIMASLLYLHGGWRKAAPLTVDPAAERPLASATMSEVPSAASTAPLARATPVEKA